MPKARALFARQSGWEVVRDSIVKLFKTELEEGKTIGAALICDQEPITSPMIFVIGNKQKLVILLKQDAKDHLRKTSDHSLLDCIERILPAFSLN